MAPSSFSDPHESGEHRGPDDPGDADPRHASGDPLEALFAADSAPDRGTPKGSGTGPGFTTYGTARPLVRLTPVAAPDPDRVAQQAASAPLVTQLDRVREHLGPRGVALTATGNPKLVDAKALRDLFATTDPWERVVGDRVVQPRSAAQLPQMMYLLEVGITAGALSHDGRRLAPAPDWETLDPVQRCAVLFDSVMTIGPAPRRGNTHGAVASAGHDVEELMQAGIVHLSVPAFITGEVPYDEIADLALDTISDELTDLWPELARDGALERLSDQYLNQHLDTFERCGIIERRHVERATDPVTGVSHAVGGTVAMGDLGRHLLAPLLPTIGYRVRMPVDLAVGSAFDAADTLSSSLDADPGEIWSDWLPGADPADKVDQLMDALAQADIAPLRLALASLLSEAPVDARRRVEAFVDGPLGAYALMALDPALSGMPSVDLADSGSDGRPAEGGPHMSTTMLTDGRTVGEVLIELDPTRSLLPMVDLLWMEMGIDPDVLIASVSAMDAVGDGGMFVDTLQELWRVAVPETAELLEFLHQHHPDDRLAQASRVALERHRTVTDEP